jgi:hypothetical protein
MMISDDWDVRLAVLGHLLPLDSKLKVSVQRLPLQWVAHAQSKFSARA